MTRLLASRYCPTCDQHVTARADVDAELMDPEAYRSIVEQDADGLMRQHNLQRHTHALDMTDGERRKFLGAAVADDLEERRLRAERLNADRSPDPAPR